MYPTIIWGFVVSLILFAMAVCMLFFGRWLKRFFEGNSLNNTKIDLRIFILMALGTVPSGLLAASHQQFPRLSVFIGLPIAILIWFYVSMMSAVFYSRGPGQLKNLWLDFWFQLTDPASWGILPFPYGRRMRTLRQSARVGHFDLRQLPLVMWVNTDSSR